MDLQFSMIPQIPESGSRFKRKKEEVEDDDVSSMTSMSSVYSTDSVIEKLGYSWARDSTNWVLWTLWDPDVLDKLFPVTRLRTDESSSFTRQEFQEIINLGINKACLDSSFRLLKSPLEMRFIMLRLDLDNLEEPFKMSTKTVEIKATEITFNNVTVSCRFSPVLLMACAGLAEILRAVCKNSDVLIIAGTYVRSFSPLGESLLLLNVRTCNGHLQILRLPFLDTAEIYMVEKIKPIKENRYEFRYFVRHKLGRTRREVTRRQNFSWFNASDSTGLSKESKNLHMFNEFATPIQYDQDPCQVYEYLLSKEFELIPKRQRKIDTCQSLKMSFNPVSEQSGKDGITHKKVLKQPPSQSSSRAGVKMERPFKIASARQDSLRHSRWPEQVDPLHQNAASFYQQSRGSKFFEICGKCVVTCLVGLIFVALFLTIVPQKCCNDNRSGNAANCTGGINTKENAHANTVSYLFTGTTSVVAFVRDWIVENCGWNELMRHLGFFVVNDGPIV